MYFCGKSIYSQKDFVTLRLKPRSYSISEIKTNEFVLYFSRLFVTLEEFAGFLCIKAVPRIEKKIGLRTGDRSVFSNIKVVGNDEVITGKKT